MGALPGIKTGVGVSPKVCIGTHVKPFAPINQYQTVLDSMIVKPLLADQINQNTWVKDLLPVWDKAIVLDNFALPDTQASLINWKNPGTFNPTLVNNPIFQAYKGFKGANIGPKSLNLHFTPSVGGAGFLGQNDITIIIGINEQQDNTTGAGADFGCIGGSSNILISANSNHYTKIVLNGTQESYFYTTGSKKYFTISRNNGLQIEEYQDLLRKIKSNNSVALCEKNLYGCGDDAWDAGINTLSFIGIFKYLSQEEVHTVIKANDRYLNKYGNKIRGYQTKVDLNVIFEGHSFLAQDSVNIPMLEGVANIANSFGVAAGGETIAAISLRSDLIDSKLIIETETYKNILLLWIGVNDLGDTVGQGLTVYNNYKTYVQNRILAGHTRILAFTMTPTTQGKGSIFESERIIFNNKMLTDLSLLPNVHVLNTDSISQLSNPADTSIYYDLLHLTMYGIILASDLFKNKIDELYG